MRRATKFGWVRGQDCGPSGPVGTLFCLEEPCPLVCQEYTHSRPPSWGLLAYFPSNVRDWGDQLPGPCLNVGCSALKLPAFCRG